MSGPTRTRTSGNLRSAVRQARPALLDHPGRSPPACRSTCPPPSARGIRWRSPGDQASIPTARNGDVYSGAVAGRVYPGPAGGTFPLFLQPVPRHRHRRARRGTVQVPVQAAGFRAPNSHS